MNPNLQLAIAIAAALVASLLIIALDLAQRPLFLLAVVLVACCVAPLLSRSPTAPAIETPGNAAAKREEGEVKWFNVSKGFGFIRRQNGEEIFVHFRSIRKPEQREAGRRDENRRERRALRDGQRVSFVVVDSDKGAQAEDVEALR